MPAALDPRVELEILERLEAGESVTLAAREAGVAKGTVTRLRRELAVEAGMLCGCGKVKDHAGECPKRPNQHDACVKLWAAVIERAAEDAVIMERVPVTDHQRKRRREVEKDTCEPARFFDDPWFVQVCHMCNTDPDKIRAGLRQRGYPV